MKNLFISRTEAKKGSIEQPRLCIFVRHGEGENHPHNIAGNYQYIHPLTAKGWKQAENVAEELLKSQIRIDGLYSGPLRRTLDTARIISGRLSIDIDHITDLLNERDYGKDRGRKFRSHVERVNVKHTQIENNYPDWENWKALLDRVGLFQYDYVNGNAAEKSRDASPIVVVAVTHSTVIKAAMGYVMKKDEMEMENIHVRHGSMTGIDFSRSGEDAILFKDKQELSERKLKMVKSLLRAA